MRLGEGERKAESLEGYYRQFTQEQLGQIKAVAMDMWEPYFKATLKHVPGAAGKIVHDRFHIMKHVGEAVDRVRKHEHRELLAQEDQRLKGTKYLWLYREENVPDKHRPALEALKAANLKVAKAWAMKESLNDVWKYLSSGWARRFVKRWLVWVNKSDLAPMRKVGEMIQGHLENILTFCRHRISATAIVAAVGQAKEFKNGREFSAWLGLVPRQNSSGGKTKLQGISKRGDIYLRTLLIHGARAVAYRGSSGNDARSQWLRAICDRRGMNRAVVARANKTARIVWAVLAKGEAYKEAA